MLYLSSKTYPVNATTNQKRNIRRLAQKFKLADSAEGPRLLTAKDKDVPRTIKEKRKCLELSHGQGNTLSVLSIIFVSYNYSCQCALKAK